MELKYFNMNKLNALFEKFLDIINWYKITDIFSNWVFPAHDLQNLLIHRHDRIKIPQVKPWEYTDMTYFMLCANMEMIVKFIEQEKPEKYVLWYKDEKGQDVGHKYGECGIPILYPELKEYTSLNGKLSVAEYRSIKEELKNSTFWFHAISQDLTFLQYS